MASAISILEESVIKTYADNYEKNAAELKNRISNYFKSNNEKEFFYINSALKRLGDSQIILPKKIRKQKTLKEIKQISKSLQKVDKKLKAFELIDKEIVTNKTTESEQTHKRNLENYLKIKKQRLLSKANKIIFDFNSLQLTSFDGQFNSLSIQKRTKKGNLQLDGLAKKIRKKNRDGWFIQYLG